MKVASRTWTNDPQQKKIEKEERGSSEAFCKPMPFHPQNPSREITKPMQYMGTQKGLSMFLELAAFHIRADIITKHFFPRRLEAPAGQIRPGISKGSRSRGTAITLDPCPAKLGVEPGQDKNILTLFLIFC
jgi:hypothetical protein